MRYAVLVAYDGTDLAGWWRQPGLVSVTSLLDEALHRIGEPHAEVMGASRTDAGVHARGQVAHVDLERHWDLKDLQRSWNHHLPPAVRVLGVAPVEPDFHAVHGVVRKTYRYAVDLGHDPYLSRVAWQPPYRLDPGPLSALAAGVPGMRTAAAFARRGDHREDLTVRISSCRWHRRGAVWILSLTADRFTYRLVRSLVGGMLATAQGTCRDADWWAALAGNDSPAGRQQAPARGLHLWRICYPRQPDFRCSMTQP